MKATNKKTERLAKSAGNGEIMCGKRKCRRDEKNYTSEDDEKGQENPCPADNVQMRSNSGCFDSARAPATFFLFLSSTFFSRPCSIIVGCPSYVSSARRLFEISSSALQGALLQLSANDAAFLASPE
ncbi:hypothetical protein MRX96_043492 [Rhipicephalus microplus]